MVLKHISKAAIVFALQKIVPKTFGILTGKHLCWSLFLIKLQAFRTVARLVFYMHSSDFISLWLNKTLRDFIKGTVMQIEKPLINDRLHVSKIP